MTSKSEPANTRRDVKSATKPVTASKKQNQNEKTKVAIESKDDTNTGLKQPVNLAQALKQATDKGGKKQKELKQATNKGDKKQKKLIVQDGAVEQQADEEITTVTSELKTINCDKVDANPVSKLASKSVSKSVSKPGSKVTPKTESKASLKQMAVLKAKTLEVDDKQQTDEGVVENFEKDQISETESDIEDDKDKTKFDKLVEHLATTIKNINALQKTEKLLIKKITNAHKTEVKRAGNRKRKPNSDPTGFVVQKEISGKFADWLKVARGTMMSGPEISKTFWKRIAEEGLQYEDDKRIFRTNKEVSKIFGVSENVNQNVDSSDKEGFNMRTYQTHITYALTHHNV